MKHCQNDQPSRSALSLAEVVVSTLLVGILLVAALRCLAASTQTNSVELSVAQSMILARELLDEVAALAYEDPDETPEWGPESGEVAGKRNRSQADDIDDLDDWEEKELEDRNGKKVKQYKDWSRSIVVSKINTAAGTIRLPDSAADTGLRMITVSVVGPDGIPASISCQRTREGGVLQPQGVSQEVVTWVGINLTPNDGSPVETGVSLLNHASDQ